MCLLNLLHFTSNSQIYFPPRPIEYHTCTFHSLMWQITYHRLKMTLLYLRCFTTSANIIWSARCPPIHLTDSLLKDSSSYPQPARGPSSLGISTAGCTAKSSRGLSAETAPLQSSFMLRSLDGLHTSSGQCARKAEGYYCMVLISSLPLFFLLLFS